ncbi:MAG: 50S ribosomal protein L21 [Bacteroidota bacterium]
MYSIVEIAGQQFKVSKGQEILVHRLEGNSGDKVEFSNILLSENNGSVEVGAPYVNGKVSATILEHVKDDKVIVLKKKRRKGYRVKNGHRQSLTKIVIDNVK